MFDEKNLTEKQKTAALELALGELSLNEICERHDIGRTSLWEWRRDSNFKAYLEELAKEVQDTTRNELKLRTGQYLKELHKLVGSKSEKVKLDALKTLMGMAGISSEISTKLELTMPEPRKDGRLTQEKINLALKELEDEELRDGKEAVTGE